MRKIFSLFVLVAVVAFLGCKDSKTIAPSKIPDPPKDKPVMAAPTDSGPKKDAGVGSPSIAP